MLLRIVGASKRRPLLGALAPVEEPSTASTTDFPRNHRRLILTLQPRLVTSARRQGNDSLRYLFEDFALDTDRRELRRAANVVQTTPQVFDLLDYLIRHRDRVVSKDDLINAVWNGRIVSDAALTTRLNVARTAIGDGGDRQRLIKTFPRKGFRFVGAVHELEGRTIAAHGGAVTPIHTSAPRLSIVVLPFANIGGDREQDYFIDGVTESLTTDLSRINLSLIHI